MIPRRTWPFGTRKQVRVLRVTTVQRERGPVPCLFVAETGPDKEGHVLIDAGGEQAKEGDVATIIFTHGGRTGGFWKYQPKISTMIHREPHPLAGQTLRIKRGVTRPDIPSSLGDLSFRLEDWWDRLSGKSWQESPGNPACMIYLTHLAAKAQVPDNEVVYGKVGSFGMLLHVSELEVKPHP